MSQHNRMRRAGDDLPLYPKFTADGKLLRTAWGAIIQEDHFKRINTIRKEARHEADIEIGKATNEKERAEAARAGKLMEEHLVLSYMKRVRAYDVTRRRREKKRFLVVAAVLILFTGIFIYSILK